MIKYIWKLCFLEILSLLFFFPGNIYALILENDSKSNLEFLLGFR